MNIEYREVVPVAIVVVGTVVIGVVDGVDPGVGVDVVRSVQVI